MNVKKIYYFKFPRILFCFRPIYEFPKILSNTKSLTYPNFLPSKFKIIFLKKNTHRVIKSIFSRSISQLFSVTIKKKSKNLGQPRSVEFYCSGKKPIHIFFLPRVRSHRKLSRAYKPPNNVYSYCSQRHCREKILSYIPPRLKKDYFNPAKRKKRAFESRNSE